MPGNYFMNVTIPQKFDFVLNNIETKEVRLLFLQRMCDESKDKPITKEDKPIGVINYSVINDTQDGIISYGTIWCNIENELFKNENEFGFSSIVISKRRK